jgi:capsular polysaccharide biosynthesis protein
MAQNKEISTNTLISNWRFIAVFMALFASPAFLVSTLITPQYKSEAEILILQKNREIAPYGAAKASEFAGQVLQGVTGSSDFMNGILQKMGENPSKFGDTPEKQITNWSKAVDISSVINTGIVKITILDPSKRENRKIMEAVLDELQNNGAKYHGNENITLKKIGGPIYFDNPAYPIIWLNVVIAAVIGLFTSVGLIFIFGGEIGRVFSKRKQPEIIFRNGNLNQGFYHINNSQ